MSTRCKVGDIAIITGGGIPENLGVFIKIVEAGPQYEGLATWLFEDASRPICAREMEGPPWRFTGKCTYYSSSRESDGWLICRDIDLTPIRDQPGTDETLLWAPVPRETVAA